MKRFIKLSDADNIVLALEPLKPGETLAGVEAMARVPRGHKMAVRKIRKDDPIVKYGQTIGFAREDIAAGDWVHEHNVYVRAFERDYAFGTSAHPTEFIAEDQRAVFQRE